ncbi:MAG: hypothetical protein KY395_03380, partial [Actinobacteria bacterium]|nr:hypothetical protein [Actinomycetota bacterium]
CGLGLSEAQTSPLVGPEDHDRVGWDRPTISGANPMVREESVLRASLMPGLLRSLAYNASHRNPDVRLYELGKVFEVPGDPRSDLPDENERVACAMAACEAPAAVGVWRTLADHLRLSRSVLTAAEPAGLHPERTASISIEGRDLGFVGEVHPAVLDEWGLEGPVAWLDLDLESTLAAPVRPIEQQPVSRFPSSDIDLAFEVPDEVAAGEVDQTIRNAAGELLVDLALFDVYRGPGVSANSRGLAFRLRLQALDRTLTDKDVAGVRGRVIDGVTKTHGATLRGAAD